VSKIFSGGKAMNTNQGVKANERTAAILLAGKTWGLNVVLYGLLIDIMYRSAVLHEAPWDLFALIGLSGAVSAAYAARHKVLGHVFGRRTVFVLALSALVAAVISFILAMTKAM
jgi:hypothetical protein